MPPAEPHHVPSPGREPAEALLERHSLRAGRAGGLVRGSRGGLLAHDPAPHDREVWLGAIGQRALEDVVGTAWPCVLNAGQLPAVGAEPIQHAPAECAVALAL